MKRTIITTAIAAMIAVSAAPTMANDVFINQYGYSNSSGGSQTGWYNRFGLQQRGSWNTGLSRQNGNRNISAIGQEGRNNRAETIQRGNRNAAGIGQFGTNHNAIISQDGNGNITAGLRVIPVAGRALPFRSSRTARRIRQ